MSIFKRKVQYIDVTQQRLAEVAELGAKLGSLDLFKIGWYGDQPKDWDVLTEVRRLTRLAGKISREFAATPSEGQR